MVEFENICQTENINDKFSYFDKWGAIYDKNNRYIQAVPFYGLSEYWHYLQRGGPDTPFVQDANIDKAIISYVFDMELKSLIMKAIQNIEKSLKQCFIGNVYKYSDAKSKSPLKRGEWIHENYINFSPGVGNKNKQVRFKTYNRFLNGIDAIVLYAAKKEKVFLDDYQIIHKMNFGALKTIYRMSNQEMRKDIVSHYSMINSDQFEKLLSVIKDIRNVSAHYDRLWNINIGNFIDMKKEETHVLYHVLNLNKEKLDKTYNVLVWIIYMLKQIDSTNDWKQDLLALIEKYEDRNYTKGMGFPDGWKEMDFWK